LFNKMQPITNQQLCMIMLFIGLKFPKSNDSHSLASLTKQTPSSQF
jgi:hypothetical protein